MTRESLENIIEKAYERYDATAQEETYKINNMNNEITVAISSKTPDIGAKYYFLISEIEKEIKDLGFQVTSLGFFRCYYIMQIK